MGRGDPRRRRYSEVSWDRNALLLKTTGGNARFCFAVLAGLVPVDRAAAQASRDSA